jgi:hypothetical protein
MTDRHDDASGAASVLQSFRQATEALRAPAGAKERALAALLGADVALERAGAISAGVCPPAGAKERIIARIEAGGQRPVVLRPRGRWALAGVGLLVASSVGAMTLPGVSTSLPFRLLPSLAPAPTLTVPALGPAHSRPAAPHGAERQAAAPAAPPEGEGAKAPGEGQPPASEPTAPATAPAAPLAEPTAPAVDAAAPSPSPAAPAEAKARAAARPSGDGHASSDTLARQVGEYQRALSLAGRNDEAALSAWRAFARRWPTSPLRHEVDLQIVAALGRLGRRHELDAAARGFLRDHPQSPRSGDVRGMLREGGR